MSASLNDEQRLELCRSITTSISDMLRDDAGLWKDYISSARMVMQLVDDSTGYLQQADQSSDYVYIVASLQQLAFVDADNGPLTDIDAWTSRQWLGLLHWDGDCVVALRGMGWAWLQRAQPALARIHSLDGSSSSSSSNRSMTCFNTLTDGHDAQAMDETDTEAARRADTADYVEARGYLQPATEYLARAVAAASAQGRTSGELLATAAEAFMSLGNASSPRVNEPLFHRAVVLLRSAASIEGYILPEHLQQYLDDFGRFVS